MAESINPLSQEMIDPGEEVLTPLEIDLVFDLIEIAREHVKARGLLSLEREQELIHDDAAAELCFQTFKGYVLASRHRVGDSSSRD